MSSTCRNEQIKCNKKGENTLWSSCKTVNKITQQTQERITKHPMKYISPIIKKSSIEKDQTPNGELECQTKRFDLKN